MQDDIRAMLGGAEIDGTGHRGINHQGQPQLPRQGTWRVHRHHPGGRIHRRLEIERTGGSRDGATPTSGFAGIHKTHLHTKRGEFLLKKPARFRAQPAAGQQVIARPEQGHHRAGHGRHAARQHDGGLGLIQLRQVPQHRVGSVPRPISRWTHG